MTSCNVQGNQSNSDEFTPDFRITPSDREEYKKFGSGPFMNMPHEPDYKNIEISLDKDVYQPNDKVVVTLKNNNPGHGFYYFNTPEIYFENQGSYEYIEFINLQPGMWEFCGIEGSKDQFSTNAIVDLTDAKFDLSPGKYKLVFFVGERDCIAYFEVK